MRSLAQIGYAAVVAAALLTSSTSSAGRGEYPEERSQHDQDLERLLNLMAPLARAVLGSSDRQELEANIDEQLFSGVFSDLVVKSIRAVGQHPWADDVDQSREQFLETIVELGGDRATTDKALWLSQISTQLSFELVQASLADADVVDDVEILQRFDVQGFLYDIEIPAEVREAAQADLESAICMVALTYAAATNVHAPAWLIGELVERWLSGQVKSLPCLVAVVLEQGVALEDVLSDELSVHLGELLELSGVPDLDAARQRADTMVACLDAIADHASRQEDGVWPKS